MQEIDHSIQYRDPELTLVRTHSFPTCTLGEIYLPDGLYQPCEKLYTLELPWKDNKRCVSCIPEGTYPLKLRTYGRYYELGKERWGLPFSVEIDEVEGRGDILAHWGNTTKDTRGCVLVGLYRSHDGVLQSRTAYQYLCKVIEEYDIESLVVMSPDSDEADTFDRDKVTL